MKFYAISAGRKTGIFTKRREYTQYTANFSGVCAKAFATKEEAATWLESKKQAGLVSTKPAKYAAQHHSAAQRYYAVSKGRKTGIITDTALYYAYTQRYKGARAKSFSSYHAAKAWLQREQSYQTHTLHHAAPRILHTAHQGVMLQKRIHLSRDVKAHINTLDVRRILALDIELTGLLPTDEILQVSIVNGLGQVVYNHYFCPQTVTSWEKTVDIHHITPSMVADKPSFQTAVPVLTQLFAEAQLIVGYSTMQDISNLHKYGVPFPHQPIYLDIGDAYSFVNTDILHPRTYAKLKTCAAHYGYTDTDWHNSLADTKATLYCFYAMLDDADALFRLMSFGK